MHLLKPQNVVVEIKVTHIGGNRSQTTVTSTLTLLADLAG